MTLQSAPGASRRASLVRSGVRAGLVLGGGSLLAEAAARWGSVPAGAAVQLVTAAAAVWWVWRGLRGAPRWRSADALLTAVLAAAAGAWFLVRHGRPLAATGVVGVTAMAAGCRIGLGGIRLCLGGTGGITGVARAVVDEAVRMRAAVALVVILVVLVPTLPLVLDPSERLQYRLQFVLAWALGGSGLVLSILSIILACGSVCGDIESSRIHMTLAKPLQRWEYLLGKWLGVVVFDLLLVGLAGAGTYTLAMLLAGTAATDAADRAAVDREVLVSRTCISPLPSNPEEHEQAVTAAIEQFERDDPETFARSPAAARRRIRQAFDWQWHTVTPDMVSTFVFRGLDEAQRRSREDPQATVQLHLRPRAHNVDVDLADVMFAIWLNDRPWPVEEGVHGEQRIPTLTDTVLDLPATAIGDDGELRVTIANRNLVPDGETRPTAITFSPGDGMRVFSGTGGFAGNFARCLVVMWIKLAMVAAVGVAAASCLGFPMAVLASSLVTVTALGSGYLRAALGVYNVAATSWLGAAGERFHAAWAYALESRYYEAFRMLAGFVTDLVLWMVPAFSEYDAVGSVVTGTSITAASVAECLWRIGILTPLLVGVVAAWAFDRRDLVRSST